MGVPFQVDVNVVTHAEQVDALEQKLSKMQNKSVDIKFNVQGQNQINNIIQQLQNVQRQGINLNLNNNNMARSAQNAARQYTQNFQRQINSSKLKYNIDTGKYAAASSRMSKQLGAYGTQDTANIQKATTALASYNQALDKLQNHYNGSNVLGKQQLRQAFQDMTKAGDTFKNTLSQIRDESSKALSPTVANTSGNKIVEYMNANSRAVKKYGASLKTLEQQYRSMTTIEEKANYDKVFANLKSRIDAEGLSGNSWFGELKRATGQIAQFAGVYGMLQNTVMQIPYKAITAVKDYDAAMTNMQMATGISNTQAQELMNTYSDMGKQLKVTGVDVATSATEWMKQGKTIEESNKLAQDSIVLSKIGDLSSDDATRTITAAMKSYDLNESQVMDFVDQISAIDMASATDVGGLADAFNEVAANANQAGISTKQLLSYAAVIGETTQEGMSSVGTSLNAIFSRMGNIKLSRLKDYQNGGEDLSNVETVLRGVGISLRDTDGEFRNFGDVLDETADRWSEFGTVQQRAVAQAFSGTNHMNDFMVLMQQYSKAQEYMQIADDASGTSMEKYSAYTDSLEGKLEGLKSTFESLSNTVLDSDALKGFVSGGTDVLGLIDKLTNSLGVMGTVAVGAGIFQGKNNSGKSTWDSPHAFFKMTYAA